MPTGMLFSAIGKPRNVLPLAVGKSVL
jgi:hypothetical protein